MKTHWAVLLAIFIILTTFILWYFDEYLRVLFIFFNGKKSLAEAMTYAGATAGGIILIGNLLVNNKRLREQEKTNELTRKALAQTRELQNETNRLAVKKQLDARFKDAVALLASENTNVILSGIHALAQIAVEDSEINANGQKDYVRVIMNIFLSLIKENSHISEGKNKNGNVINNDESEIIIQTIQAYLKDSPLKQSI
ncbi:MAG: hypothetical protein FWC34_06940 [Bacteroidetes bacterium]|nr:hypothetical protein [Bacteroidota bacterium]MCL2302884.1 hypothetical protein [Lentimicrobiaceae bacterium]